MPPTAIRGSLVCADTVWTRIPNNIATQAPHRSLLMSSPVPIRTPCDIVPIIRESLMLLWNRLKTHAATQGDKLALACGDTRLTYAQLADEAEQVAHAWLRQGCGPGDRIARHM